MKVIVFIVVFLLANVLGGFSWWCTIAVLLWTWYMVNLFEKANDTLAFREFILMLYGLNYLLAPAITFNQSAAVTHYKMKLTETEYFELAIPAMLFLQLGIYSLKTKIFNIKFEVFKAESFLNQAVLKQWLFIGVLFYFISPMVPSELAFFLYLLSGIRYVAAFGLFVLNKAQFKWHLLVVLGIEVYFSLQQGMFHDLLMWLIFFGLFWVYTTKPSAFIKSGIAIMAVLAFYVIQVTKSDYREKIGSDAGQAGISNFQSAALGNINSEEGLFNPQNIAGSLTRVNQAWIFASAVNKTNYTLNFQQFNLVVQYAEAAFLPRFIAPNKLEAGNKEIFNRFAGHKINKGTSMGLGMFADGYIAFGFIGVIIFAFALGLILALVFKIAEGWATISPFFILFIFPILNYAVRPDCETQTIMGHIVKGLFTFGLMMFYYKSYFEKNTRKLQEFEIFKNKETVLTT